MLGMLPVTSVLYWLCHVTRGTCTSQQGAMSNAQWLCQTLNNGSTTRVEAMFPAKTALQR